MEFQRVSSEADKDLKELEYGSRVAVVTLLGSLSPITLAHVEAFVEARKLLLSLEGEHNPSLRPPGLEDFAFVLGFISLNPDNYVDRKLLARGVNENLLLDFDQRAALVHTAISDLPWMNVEMREGQSITDLRKDYPHLIFSRITMNGADDVAGCKKWKWVGKPAKKRGGMSSVSGFDDTRFITMGRKGDTERVVEGMKQCGMDPNPNFIIGPELPNVSSTRAREALGEKDVEALGGMLHPQVTRWCLEEGPWSSAK